MRARSYAGPTCDDLAPLTLTSVQPKTVYGGGGNTTISLTGKRFSEAYRLVVRIDGTAVEVPFLAVTPRPREAQASPHAHNMHTAHGTH